MEADHRTICKFLASSSQNYIIIRDCITELVDSTAVTSDDSGV